MTVDVEVIAVVLKAIAVGAGAGLLIAAVLSWAGYWDHDDSEGDW